MRKLFEGLFCIFGLMFAVWVLAAYGHITLPHFSVSEGHPRVLSMEEWEAQCRATFVKEHSGAQPVNWLIGKAAERYYKERPQGKYVLHKNDCSDFVECLVDDALGAKARFRRDSNQHLAMRGRGLFYTLEWRSGVTVNPGDVINVRHSPWYAPSASSNISHVGVMGTDGKVYDYTKLRSWKTARYGRVDFDFFIRYSLEPGQVTITRLLPEYKYRIKPTPWPLPTTIK